MDKRINTKLPFQEIKEKHPNFLKEAQNTTKKPKASGNDEAINEYRKILNNTSYLLQISISSGKTLSAVRSDILKKIKTESLKAELLEEVVETPINQVMVEDKNLLQNESDNVSNENEMGNENEDEDENEDEENEEEFQEFLDFPSSDEGEEYFYDPND